MIPVIGGAVCAIVLAVIIRKRKVKQRNAQIQMENSASVEKPDQVVSNPLYNNP